MASIDLRVLLRPDGPKWWFAQSLEADYSAQGRNPTEAKRHFEIGLLATMDLHWSLYGNLRRFLVPSPEDVWVEFYNHLPKSGSFRVPLVGVPPISGIQYFHPLWD